MHMELKTIQRSQAGWSLIEILVALVVITVGVLGVLTMQSSAMQGNRVALERSQATVLAHDMAERMRAWPDNLAGYSHPLQDDPLNCAAWVGAFDSALADRQQWTNQVACTLPGARTRIALAGTSVDIEIRWASAGRSNRQETLLVETEL